MSARLRIPDDLLATTKRESVNKPRGMTRHAWSRQCKPGIKGSRDARCRLFYESIGAFSFTSRADADIGGHDCYRDGAPAGRGYSHAAIQATGGRGDAPVG